MANTAERVRTLVAHTLEWDELDEGEVDWSRPLSDPSISSIAAMAFQRELVKEFDISISPEQFASLPNLQALVDFIDNL